MYMHMIYAYGHHELPGDLQDSGGGIIYKNYNVCTKCVREREIKFKERRYCIYMHTTPGITVPVLV